MSLLAQQLNKLKQNNAVSIAPGAPKATLILDKQTAKNTTNDVLYTMALLGYAEIKKEAMWTARTLAEQLLTEQYRDINRNKLSKEENKALSVKITRLLLTISPLFLNRGCQAVLQYLIRNFNIHVFEAEQLVLIYIQYWQHESYIRLISNVETKNANLQFIKNLQQGKQVNLTYIIKSLTYSRSLLDSLIMFTRKYIKQENTESEEIQIRLQSKPTIVGLQVEESTVVKRDFKQFLLQILCLVLQRKISNFNKEISEFCIFTSKQDNDEVQSMSMMLSISLLSSEEAHSEWIQRVVINLLSKSVELNENIFNFIIVIWQRWPNIINHKIIGLLLQKQHFVLHLTQFGKSLHMPFFMLFEYFLEPKLENKGIALQILQALALKVKDGQFVRTHQINYFQQIFNMVHQNFEKLQKNEQKTLLKMIKGTLLYEYAIYISESKTSPLSGAFTKEQINKNGLINFNTVNRVEIQKIEEKKIEKAEDPVQSQDEQQRVFDSQNKENISLIKVLNSWSNNQIHELNLKDPEIRHLASVVLKKYYEGVIDDKKLSLTLQQKNRLFENPLLFQEYGKDKFDFDLSKNDYNTCIRYLIKSGTIENCYQVLIKACESTEIAGDLLYRELCRQATQKLASYTENHYSQVIISLGKLYYQYYKVTQVELLKPLNEIMIKLSSSVLGASGTGKGKYYKLIAFHSRFLAKLTISLAHRQSYALETYLRLIQIFGVGNIYCFLIGASELLATKQTNKKLFGNFIDKVLIPSLQYKSEQQGDHQYKSCLSFLHNVNKCLSFCYFMLQQSKNEDHQNSNQNHEQKEDQNQQNIQSLERGVAKKMITNFFGLATVKNKRTIVRKIFLFFSTVFKSLNFSTFFKQALTKINRKQQLKLTSTTSKVYSNLVTIFNLTIGPLQQTSGAVKQNILKLFPLQLKIDVLGPLLPLNEVYSQLGNDLIEHSTRKFDNLNLFINIIPNKISDEWNKFAIQCIKRGYFPTEETTNQILSLFKEGSDNTNLVKFICSMTQYAREECLSSLDSMMKIIFKECGESNDYSLAVLFTIIKNLKEFVDPYLGQIFQIGIETKSQNAKKFIDGVVEAFTAPTLVSLVKNHAKTVENYINFSYFLQKISSKVTFESIWKTCQNFFSRSLSNTVENEESFKDLHERQADVFVSQALKMNEDQLRKVIIDYVRWSSERTNSDSNLNLHFNSRRNLLYVVFQKLVSKLGDLFIQFYGYIFEDIVKDLKSLSIFEESKNLIISQKSQKRDRQINPYNLRCCAEYTEQILDCLRHLFDNDKENEFLDSIKFDTLSPEISKIFSLVKFEQYYSSIVNEHLRKSLISLFANTKDDYKLKTINTQILRLLRTKDQRITSSIFAFYDEVVPSIEHRFLIFTDEMVPLLIEASSSRNPAIKKSVESIIYKIQNLSGQKIGKIGSI